jgi:hypothetical protein
MVKNGKKAIIDNEMVIKKSIFKGFLILVNEFIILIKKPHYSMFDS